MACIAATLAMSFFPTAAQAHQYCENILSGMAPGQRIGTSADGSAIIGQPTPIYETRCVWKYGAVAIDPETRAFSSAWNYDTPDAARAYVESNCGARCLWVSFGENLAWIALSEDDRIWASSTSSAADAAAKCGNAGGRGCETVLAASSAAAAIYWKYGALSYDAATGASGSAWNHFRRAEAAAGAKASCGSETCWTYAFQSGFAGMAKAPNGELFAQWSANSEKGAGKAAIRDCEKIHGKKSCTVVLTGAAAK